MSNDGGPAFPTDEETSANGDIVCPAQWGMTLRDYFAGQALVKVIHYELSPEQIAEEVYRISDAMLKEREGE